MGSFSVDRDLATVDAMHKSQVLIVLALAYIAGVAIGSLNVVNEPWMVRLVTLALLLLVVSVYRRTFGESAQGYRRRMTGVLTACLLFVCVGGIYRYGYVNATHGILSQYADRRAGTQLVSTTMQGYVDGDPVTTNGRTSVPFRVTEILAASRVIFVHERMLVYLVDADVRYGAFLQLRGTPETPKAISSFDYAAYLRKDGISYIVSSPKAQRIEKLYHLTWRDRVQLALLRPLITTRNAFITSLQQAVPDPAAPYLTGMLLGIRSQLSDAMREAFNRTSTSHILAISGYNISIVAQLVMSVFLLALYRRRAFWVTIMIIGLFTLMTGASASVLRAAIMGVLVLAALSYGRLYDGTTAVVSAGAVMLVVNPLLLRSDIGFQLSFVATLGIMLVYEPIETWLRKKSIGESLRPVLATTLAAQIAVMPLLAYHFQTVSLLALPVNVLILPFVPPAMLLGFVAGALGLVWSLGAKVVGTVAWAVSAYQLLVVQLFADIPWSAVRVSVSPVVVMIIYAIMGWYLWRYRYAK
ncbi:MAG: ComEC/Rec2 family competence protein [Patescibacteria group bacterium]